MPSTDEKTTPYLIQVMPETHYRTLDVDLLVSQIKKSLRFTNLKAKSSVSSHKPRSSPYLIPSRIERQAYFHNQNNDNNSKTDEDDPYEKLRELIKQGRLIKEAVKKLQMMNFENLSNNTDSDDQDRHDDDDDDENTHHRTFRRKTFYYDSEDEPLPAVYDSLDL
ncbi:uncharacterized protein LOC103577868 [Microplitis demolitor]|uniref:uncharacterized protein LOC103577868 n=1 Tax=Microplitis demolitor TaxID=69319 RepID=UPI00044000A9|nr:uncharacterized protein LOC103577868 [Microplitis demolitor]